MPRYYSAVDAFASFLARQTHFDVRDLLTFASYHTHTAKDGFLDIHPRTVTRWIEANALPLVAVRALQYRAGDLSCIYGGAWVRWRIVGDVLYSPEDVAYPLAELRKLYELKMQVYRLECERDTLREAVADLRARDRATIEAAVNSAPNVVRFTRRDE